MEQKIFLEKLFSKKLSEFIVESNKTVVPDANKAIKNYTDYLASLIYGLVEGIITESDIINIYEAIKDLNFDDVVTVWSSEKSYDQGKVVFYGDNLWESNVDQNTSVPGSNGTWVAKIELPEATVVDLSAYALKSTSITTTGNGILGGGDLTDSREISLDFNYLDTRYDHSLTPGLVTQYYRGDKTWQTLNTAVVPESGNLYFTEARVRATPLTGYTVGSNVAIVAADSILSAFGKVQAQFNALPSVYEPIITPGATNQYWRGDKTWQILNTSVVPEGSNLYYTQARFNTSFAAKSTSDLTEGSNLYYTQARFNAAFAAKSTTDLAEGSNLYWTLARFNAAFAIKTTSDLTEGTNLYWTQTRFDNAFNAKSTSNLAEGSNLYWTQARFDTAFDNKTTDDLTEGLTNFYWTQTRFDTAFGLKSTSDLVEGTNLYYTNGRADARINIQKGVANGLAPLNSSAKIDEIYLPDSVLGQLEFQGTYNAATNTPALATPSLANKGWFYVVNVAGGIYDVGDWVLSTGTTWEKIDNSDAVTTVFGRMGNVVANYGDYTTALVAEDSGYLYFTDARVQAFADTRYSLLGHTHTFASLTSKPTTLSGYGITDGVISSRTITATGNGLTGGGDLTANRTFALDFTYLDSHFALATNLTNYYTKTESDARYKAIGWFPTFAEILSKPTTIGGFGITDAYTKTEQDARYAFVGGSNASGTWNINVNGTAGALSSYTGSSNLYFKWDGKIKFMVDSTEFAITPMDISGNAATSTLANNSTRWNTFELDNTEVNPTVNGYILAYGTDGRVKFAPASSIRTFLNTDGLYQPLEDQRLSTNNNVIFGSTASTLTNGGVFIIGKSGVGNVALLTTNYNIEGVGSSTDLNAFVYGNNPFNVWTNSERRFTVTGAGWFGFNASSPSYQFDFRGNSSPYLGRFYSTNNAATAYNVIRIEGAMTNVIGYLGVGGGSTGNASFQDKFVVGTQNVYDLSLNTNDSTRLIIKGGTGNIGIGGTYTPLGKLDVIGNIRIGYNTTDNVYAQWFDQTGSTARFYQYDGSGGLKTIIQSVGDSSFNGGSIRTSQNVTWDGASSGNARSIAIGWSGGNYGQIGYGIQFTGTSDLHKYALADIPTIMTFHNGIMVQSAITGTIGADITWVNILEAKNNGEFKFKGYDVAKSDGGTYTMTATKVSIPNYNNGNTYPLVYTDGGNNAYYASGIAQLNTATNTISSNISGNSNSTTLWGGQLADFLGSTDSHITHFVTQDIAGDGKIRRSTLVEVKSVLGIDNLGSIYQPLENQRLSTTNNVTFNEIVAANTYGQLRLRGISVPYNAIDSLNAAGTGYQGLIIYGPNLTLYNPGTGLYGTIQANNFIGDLDGGIWNGSAYMKFHYVDGGSTNPTYILGASAAGDSYVYQTSSLNVLSSGLLRARGTYSQLSSQTPDQQELGIINSFVQASDGFPSYGSLMTMRSYAGGGGGTLQMFTPYSPTYGGNNLQVRFGNYEDSNNWTGWKTLMNYGDTAYNSLNSAAWNGHYITGGAFSGSLTYILGYDSTTSSFRPSVASSVQSFLGLGSAAYINRSVLPNANTIVERDGSGYLIANYIEYQGTSNGGGPAMTAIMGKVSGGDYLYANTSTQVQTFLGLGTAAYQDWTITHESNKIARFTSNGYLYTNYINSDTGNNENGSVYQFITLNASDNFYRKAGVSQVQAALGLGNSAYATWSTGAVANTLVMRDSSGDIYSHYAFSTYIHTSDDTSSSLGYLVGKNGSDDYHRSYTASTVGAFLQYRINSRATYDANAVITSGTYGMSIHSLDNAATNTPGGSYGNLITFQNSDTSFQIIGGYQADNMWFRGAYNSGTGFTAWRQLLHSGNFTSYTSGLYQPLENQRLSSNYAPKFLGVSISNTVGSYREILFQSNGVNRWDMFAGPETESGSNLGSNFSLARYADNGDYLSTIFSIERNTGQFYFYSNVRFEANTQFQGSAIFNNSVTATTFTGNLSGTATTVSGLTITNSSNPVVPNDTVQNQIGYWSGPTLFSQADGGLYTSAYSSAWQHQIVGDFRTGQIAIRGKNSGTWQAWRTVLDSSNYNDYSPTLVGAGASGTWAINISGVAQIATSVYNGSANMSFAWSDDGTQATYYWGSNGSGQAKVYQTANLKVDGALKLWSVSHPTSYYISNTWDGTYWQLTSNHGSSVNVGHSDNSTMWKGNTFDGSTILSTAASYFIGYDGTNYRPASASSMASMLGLGSNAYQSKTYLSEFINDLTYINATYISGGTELPSYFGSNKLKLQMLTYNSYWQDVLWMSSYAGGDVKRSNALYISKTGSFQIGIRSQNFDSTTWGTYTNLLWDGYDSTRATIAGGLIVTGGSGTGYTTAELELRASSRRPVLSFHWAGTVASTISIEASGRIAIMNNPGTGYESLISSNFNSTGYVEAGDYVKGARGIFGYDSGATGSVGASAWFYSSGQTGWYNDTYGGGIRMTDTTWVRIHNGKGFLAENTIQATDFMATTVVGYSVSNYGIGLVGLYSSTVYQSVFSMGASYKPSLDGTSIGSMYGIAWTHSNVGTIQAGTGQAISGLGHQALFIAAGLTQTSIGDGIWTRSDITAVGSLRTQSELYVQNYIRSNQNGIGLYNGSTGAHFNSDDASYYRIVSANNGTVGLKLYYADNTLRGYFYSDSSGIGFLNDQGGWSVRANEGSSYGGTLFGTWGVTGRVIATAGTDGGFENSSYVAGHNNIWRLSNAAEYGIGYYQGGTDYVGFHFGARSTPAHKFYNGGQYTTIGQVDAAAFTTGGTALTNGQLAIVAGGGNGIGFWGSGNAGNYSIFMGTSATYGQLTSDGSNDYNMYFKMTSGTRGFQFITGGGAISMEVKPGYVTVAGVITASVSGGISDMRHKDLIDWNDVTLDLSFLDKDRTIPFTWKDKTIDAKNHYGYSAQEINSWCPDLVFKHDAKKWSINQTELLTLEIKRLKERVTLQDEIIKKQGELIETLI